MKISLNWIKEYLPDLEITSFEEFSQKMVSRGIDIESVEFTGDKYKNIVIGEVLEKIKHPNADKLSVCKVEIGGDVKQIVCGAPNVEAGQKVCVALIGALIPESGFEIKEVKLRGELSQGMICSEKELEISENHDGILVLNNDAEVGTPFYDYINANDYVLDIWVPPNRGDLSSHVGFAREIASAFNLKLKIPETQIKESDTPTKDLIDIEIKSTEGCKRFTGRVIKGVKISESPDWLKRHLLNIGLRPRNNVVDITNYVMMETGQPLHAFDYDKVNGKKIIVKFANEGDKFVTLDSKEHKLNSRSLMICDEQGYTGIAGIMGGEYSEITDETVNVFLEVAYFDPVVVRKNAKKLNIITDASQRFEKGVDINNIEYVSNRATSLIQQIAGGEVSKEIIDNYPEQFSPLQVGIRNSRLNKIVGEQFNEDEIINSLASIEIPFKRKEEDFLIFDIPEWRRYDIHREIDLIEEVVRLRGIENLVDDIPASIDLKSYREYDYRKIELKQKIGNYLIGRGFNEILTGSQINDEKNKVFGDSPVEIENPHSSEMSIMRTNLSYGMLNVIRNNINSSGKDISLKLFEIGKVFNIDKGIIHETDSLSICLAGKSDKYEFGSQTRNFGYFDLKGEIEMLFSKLNLENQRLFYYYESQNNTGIECEVKLDDNYFGKIRLISKDVLEVFDLEFNILIAEFDLSVLCGLSEQKVHYKPVSKFPAVKRDISIVTSPNITYDKIENVVNNSGLDYLTDFKLYDIYKDEKLGDKLSMTFSLEFVSHEKTLTDEIVNSEVDILLKNLNKNLNITLRQ